MDVKQAVRAAKKYVADILSEEPIANIGLEEVEFDEIENTWAVAIGFSRNWSRPGNVITALGGNTERIFKVVRIKDTNGNVMSIKHRIFSKDC